MRHRPRRREPRPCCRQGVGLADLRLALAGVALALSLGCCSRLNPDWCEKHASCAAGEYCDPVTNTCRPREMGADDLRLDLLPVDLPDQQPDRLPDTAPTDLPHDLPPQSG